MTAGTYKKLSEMRVRIVAALGDHYLLKIIDVAISSEDETLGQAAVDAFRGLPTETWRRIMNGWVQPSIYPEAKDLVRDPWADEPRIVLKVMADGGELKAYTDFRLWDNGGPVRIEILEGTSRKEALDSIYAAVKKLKQEWWSLITQKPPDVPDKDVPF
jgi:hypothetical protein